MFLRHASLSGGDATKEFSEMVTLELGVEWPFGRTGERHSMHKHDIGGEVGRASHSQASASSSVQSNVY